MSEPARRVAGLDGVRALAALSVVCFHVWLYRFERPRGVRTELVDQVLFHASVGLICFFVLSGYLLYRAFARAALSGGEGVAVGGYLRRRAARIVPAYWACGALSLPLFWLVGYGSLTPPAEQLPLFALFLQNYSMETIGRINPVTWTLCVEVAFYLLLPLVGWLALRLGPRRFGAQLALVGALLAITPAWNVLIIALGWEDGIARRALPAYLGAFAMGMFVALWVERARARGRGGERLGVLATMLLVAAAALVVVGDAAVRENAWWLRDGIFAPGGPLAPNVQAALVGQLAAAAGFALLVAAAARGSGPAVAWLSWRPIAAVGVISYGLYLWHIPLLLAARQLGLLPAALVPRFAIVLALSLLVAAASWRFVERPFLDRRQARRATRERPAVRPGTAAEPARS